jgi:hypothetical protein
VPDALPTDRDLDGLTPLQLPVQRRPSHLYTAEQPGHRQTRVTASSLENILTPPSTAPGDTKTTRDDAPPGG